MISSDLRRTVQANCDLSDSLHSGIYTICTLVLKLRNLFKWENGIEPWDEPESAQVLDWIAAKEDYWKTIRDQAYALLPIGSRLFDPYEVPAINEALFPGGLFYGAGLGQFMKPIFFLAEQQEEKTVEGVPTVILDKETARELAWPFAMLQEGIIYIRRQPLRFYLWDQIQEVRSSGKTALRRALSSYDLYTPEGRIDCSRLKNKLDHIVNEEIPFFIYHEVGELRDNTLGRELFQTLVSSFPHSAVEYVARAIKDVLADTHPQGLLGYVVTRKKESSLGFYTAFLDGLRKVLFPEIEPAAQQFWIDGDWQGIEKARRIGRERNQRRAETLQTICKRLGEEPVSLVQERIEAEILVPLGLGKR